MCAAPTPPASCRSASGTTGCPAPTTPRPRWSTNGREKEKVEVPIDYITSQGNKNLLTIAAEAQAQVRATTSSRFPTWLPSDARQAARAGRRRHGRADQAERRGQSDGRVPRARQTATGSRCRPRVGSQIKGPCSRIDLMKKHAGIDVQAMYPAGGAAEGRGLDARRHAQGRRGLPQGAAIPFGIGLGTTEDNVDTVGRDLPVVRRRPGRRQGQHHGQDRRRCARRSSTTRSWRSSCRRTRRPGTTPPTTSGWSPARAR